MKQLLITGAAFFAVATQASADCHDGQRAFVDDRNISVCIPTTPQRIVTTVDEAIFVPLYELGVVPVGTTGSTLPDGTPFIRGGMNNVGVDFQTADNVAFIGDYDVMDYETIAAVNPDLIIVGHWGDWFNGDIEKLSLIAPTISINIEERTGFATHDYLADITGTQAELAEVKARYTYQVETLRSVVPDGTTASILVLDSGQLHAFHTWPGLGQILRDAGIDAPDIINDIAEGQSATFSAEVLEQFDADWVFLSYANQNGETPADAIANMDALLPSWCAALTACQDGRVIPVPIVETASWSPDAFFATTMMLISTMGNPLNYN
ncbi:ABC transporter substrate-binding protein [Octadecabacter sp. G9-8]|uniref:ABC transporter substrate-binding protein n=1 Tax=Octadecabacter dasysiphoniae TaxID=2909341 RepID=A0ABS9CZ03_9RHOB|nr:ABC transporter substrate-binding protein [Octadecabacter dasysiphoniae]MCF2872034.1 ABC transporter substrate-binding protein [Octadecabacter dasysiphoniae]